MDLHGLLQGEFYILTWCLKAGMVQSEKTVIAMQRLVETRFRSNEYAGIY
jgi:hypothetical protein